MAIAVPSAVTYTPGNQNFGTMSSAAASFLQLDGTDSEVMSVVLHGINAAIALINARNWNKIYGIETITLVDDQDYHVMPADYKEPMSMHRLDTSSKRVSRVRFQPLQTFLRKNRDASRSGNVHFYSVDENQRRILWNVPVGTGYSAVTPKHQHYYHRRVPRMTQVSTTTGLSPEFDEWLTLRGALRLARVRDPDKIKHIRDDEQEMWQWLRTSDNATETDVT